MLILEGKFIIKKDKKANFLQIIIAEDYDYTNQINAQFFEKNAELPAGDPSSVESVLKATVKYKSEIDFNKDVAWIKSILNREGVATAQNNADAKPIGAKKK